MGRNSFLLFSPLGKRNYESLAKFIETGEFEEYLETESDFDEDEDDVDFGDLDNEIENDEKKEESDDDGYVTEEITEKKHDEL